MPEPVQIIRTSYRYIDDVLSLKNTKFAECLEFIHPRELEIKETTETAASSSYLDCYLYIDNGKLTTRLYDKRDDFNFPIVNFPFLSGNIPSAPAYDVYVSRLIRYARACSNYQDFMERGKVLTTKLLSQGYQKTKLVATLKKSYGRHHNLVNPYSFKNCFWCFCQWRAISRLITAKFAVSIKEKQDRLPTLYWLPKLHKRPYKARFIANSSSCTTTVLSKLLTSCLTAVKKHWIRYYDTVYERDGINYFWLIKNSNDVLNKFKSKTFQASKLSTYDFSTLYTTLPHHLIKDKLIDLINRTFIRENTQYLACNEECAFFTSDVYNNHNLWSCQKVCDALVYLLDNIFIRFGTKLYRQTIGIPMGANCCAPLVADLFLFCYEIDFMKSLSRENQADIIKAFNSTSRNLDDLLNIDNIYFDQMMDRIYPTELQLNRANSSATEAPFMDLNLCISNGTVSIKIYNKRDDFDFDIVNFPFLDGDVPRRTSYGVNISQLIRFARASSNLNDFNYRNKALTAKLLRQGYRYFKLRKAFSKFYLRHSALVE